MKDLLTLLQVITPNGVEELKRRYDILKGIEMLQPIGRRKLSSSINIPERILRSDTDFLKVNGLINVSASGMTITESGEQLLEGLKDTMKNITGLRDLELEIEQVLVDVSIRVVPGNVDDSEEVKNEIGKMAASTLNILIKNRMTIAVTGGTTVAKMVGQFKHRSTKDVEDVLVLPARGSLGKFVEYQANTLASTLANKLGAKYQLLNIPDHLSKKTLESVQKEPEINAIKSHLNNPDIIIFGIGDAIKMARRRNLSEPLMDFLIRKKAVAEAFGYYFNEEGKIIYRSRTIGVDLEKMTQPTTIALAGGKSKAKAILALKKYLKNGFLIIDEGAAKEIIHLSKMKNGSY